jgi:glycosyltransferase involved in cell wall biosynthesis
MDILQLYGSSRRILIVGTYPPPLGGISVFIYRLKKLLQAGNYEVTVFNTAMKYRFLGVRYFAFLITILKGNFQIIHVQNFDLKKIIALVLFKSVKKYRIYFTDHNPFLFDNKSSFSAGIIRILMAKIDKLIVVNHHILENYISHHVDLPEDVLVSNVFLPPPAEEKEKIISTYPADFIAFLNTRSPLVLANAYQLKWVEGIDLYGMDMCLELTKRLKKHYPEIGFIFALADEKANTGWLSKIVSQIKRDDLSRNFYILTGHKEIWPLFERMQLFVRPTYKDGYGVSIDEALYFNCAAVASNACERNPGAGLFENRNMDDFYNKCITILNKKIQHGQDQRFL